MIIKLFKFVPVFALMPVLAFAQAPVVGAGLDSFILGIIVFINGVLVPFVFAVAFLVFLWGVFQTFILGGGDEEKQKIGKKLMFYAIIGFVIMVAVWGVVNLLVGATGLGGQSIPLPAPSPGTPV